MAQLFRHLKSAGLVVGAKGPGGGYRLVRDAARISAGDVVQAVEGPLAVVACALCGSGGEPPCSRMERCVTRLLWKQLSEAMTAMLASVTLNDPAVQAQQIALMT